VQLVRPSFLFSCSFVAVPFGVTATCTLRCYHNSREAILLRYGNHCTRLSIFRLRFFLSRFVSTIKRTLFFTTAVRARSPDMACATLKRSLDFEPPMCRPTKRQRCTPMSISPSSSPPNSSRSEYVSPHFGGDVVPKITAGKLND